jgi:hypothetical protein
MMLTKEDFQTKVEVQITEFRTDIESLKTQANKIGGDARVRFNHELTDLSAQLDVVSQKLGELQQTNLEALGKTEMDIDSSLVLLQEHLDQIGKALQKTRSEMMGWAQGMADKHSPPSEGFAEGTGHLEKDSEGFAEGMGHLTPDSVGWAEGMELSQDRA